MSDEFCGLGLETAQLGEESQGDARMSPFLSVASSLLSFSFEEDLCQYHPVTPSICGVSKSVGSQGGWKGEWWIWGGCVCE